MPDSDEAFQTTSTPLQRRAGFQAGSAGIH
jgi:hypothetical protein